MGWLLLFGISTAAVLLMLVMVAIRAIEIEIETPWRIG